MMFQQGAWYSSMARKLEISVLKRTMKIFAFTCFVSLAVGEILKIEKPKIEKESPKYEIIGGSNEYEIREYAPGVCRNIVDTQMAR